MKLRSILFSIIAAGGVTMFSSTTANAQPYANPDSTTTAYARQQGPCSDPWVSIAIRTVTGRAAQGQGSFGECNVQMYNGGSWNSYNDLAQGVKLALGNMAQGNVSYNMTRSGDGTATIKLFDAGQIANTIRIRLVGNDGSTLIGTDSGGFISEQGGALISVNHSRLSYTVQSVGKEKRINLGKSVLIIKKK